MGEAEERGKALTRILIKQDELRQRGKMNPEQKQAIQERLGVVRCMKLEPGENPTASDFLALDVEALLAEVERLEATTKQLAEAVGLQILNFQRQQGLRFQGDDDHEAWAALAIALAAYEASQEEKKPCQTQNGKS